MKDRKVARRLRWGRWKKVWLDDHTVAYRRRRVFLPWVGR